MLPHPHPDAHELTPRALDRVSPVGEGSATHQVDRRRDVLTEPPEVTDPFLFLSEDWFSRVGFHWHPHRGFETVTYVISGALEHRDNAGGFGVLREADLQWVTAGRGVIHAELAYQRAPVHTLQLWLNLPAAKKLTAPRYQNLRSSEVPVLRHQDYEVRVYAGQVHGVSGPAATHWPASVAEARLYAGAHYVHELPGDHAAFFYVLAGQVHVGSERRHVKHGQVGWMDAGTGGRTGLELVAAEPTLLLAYSAPPIREPIVANGPFVMNSEEEIAQAVRDFERGEFGPIPS